MRRNIIIERGVRVPPQKRVIELVERKGLGHPDSIIDGVMEEISRELSKAYIEEFGKILHHNVDKGQICGGATKVKFGGGSFIKPIYILLSGRATTTAEGKKIPVEDIALRATKAYLKKAVRNLDVEADVEISSRISAGSPELVELFLRGPSIPLANDTSFGCGYAPMSILERVVLESETYLNSLDYKRAHPEVGEDIKVMGLREEDRIKLTVSVAFISKHVQNIDEYIMYKERLCSDIRRVVRSITKMETEISLNAADDIKKNSVYLTLTGTSAEMGDDGSAGRGNRANGLITPFREMSMEGAAGKNPVSHVGKVYNVLALEIAKQIVAELPDVEDAAVTLLSEIGKPIDQPKVAAANIVTKNYEGVKSKIHYIIDHNLENITELANKIVFGKVNVF